MIALRWIAWAILAETALLFALSTRDFAVPVAAGILGVLGAIGLLEFEAGRSRRNGILVALALAAGALMVLMPYARPATSGLFRFPGIAHAAGQGMLFLLAVQLIVRPRFEPTEHRAVRSCWGLNEVYPIYGFIVLVTAGDMTVGAGGHRQFQVASDVFAVTAMAYYTVRSPLMWRRGHDGAPLRTVVAVTVAVLGGLVGFAGSAFVLSNGERIDTFLGELIVPPVSMGQVGFSGAASLGSVAGIKADGGGTALRVYAETSPGYMRGAAFDLFQGRRWANSAQALPLRKIGAAPGEFGPSRGRTAYRVGEGAVDDVRHDLIEVWPDGELAGVLFQPLSSAFVSIRADNVEGDQHGILTAPKLPGGEPYAVLSSASLATEPLSEELRQTLLRVPPALDKRIVDLAHELLDGTTSARDAAARVERFFQANFEYTLGIEVPDRIDPMTYFLTERPAAHCEYFASGAALLLRIAGYPCRYVTGFVVRDRHPYGGYWLAENSDAHAWVEVYDPETGWFVVEATPASGVPQADGLSAWVLLVDYASATLGEAKEFISTLARGIKMGNRRLVVGLAVSGATIYILVLLGRRWLAWRRNRTVQSPPAAPDPELLQLSDLLAKCDDRAALLGLRRERGETLDRFAHRVRRAEGDAADAVSRWYFDYAAARYAGAMTSGKIRELDEQLSQAARA